MKKRDFKNPNALLVSITLILSLFSLTPNSLFADNSSLLGLPQLPSLNGIYLGIVGPLQKPAALAGKVLLETGQNILPTISQPFIDLGNDARRDIISPVTSINLTQIKQTADVGSSIIKENAITVGTAGTASVGNAIGGAWNSFINFASAPLVPFFTAPKVNSTPPVKSTNTSTVKKTENNTYRTGTQSTISSGKSVASYSSLGAIVNSLLKRVTNLEAKTPISVPAVGASTIVNNNYTYVTGPGSQSYVGDSSLGGFSQGISDQIAVVRNDLSTQINNINISNLTNINVAGATFTGSTTINGALHLSDISVPATTTEMLYNNAGNLYWAGNLLAGAAIGNWSSSGGNVYRTSGNVGIGTTTPGQSLSVVGNGQFSGNVTANAYFGDGSNLTGITSFSTSTTRNVFSSTATGLSYATSSGIFSLTSGYNIPLTASTTDWNTAFSNRITSASSPLSISANAISIALASSSANGYLSSTDWSTFNNKQGAIAASTTLTYFRGDKTFQTLDTSVVPENGNLYFTTARGNTNFAANFSGTTTDALAQGSVNKYYSDVLARNALSSTATGLSYATSSGIFSLSSGYSIPLTASTTDYQTAFANRIISITNDINVTGSLSNNNLTLGWAGLLSVARGGTGTSSLASNAILFGNATGSIQALAVNSSATNKFLTQSSSGSPAWGTISSSDLPGSFGGFANPTGAIGLTAVNGSATTAMRSDATPALSQSIAPTWTGTHIFNNGTNSALFTGGNVGIATTTPGYPLTVEGAANITGALNLNGSSGSSGSVLQSNGASAPTWVATSTLGFLSSSVTSSLTNGFLPVWTGSAFNNSIFRGNASSTGINATSSSYTFNVQGSLGVANPFNVASSTGVSLFTILGNGNIGIGTTTPSARLDIYGTTTSATSDLFAISSSTNTRLFTINANGAVGIGSSTPLAKLSIVGDTSSSAAAPLALYALGGNGGGSGAGGGFTFVGGTSGGSGGGAGGAFAFTGGAGGGSGSAGGAFTVTAGTAGSSALGGAINLTAGSAGSSGSAGGTLTLASGSGGSSAAGGPINITAGTSASGSTGPTVTITAGAAASTGGTLALLGGASSGTTGGPVTMTGGAGGSGGAGGGLTLTGGAGGASSSGGAISITAGASGGSGGAGAAVNITAANGGGSSNAAGGNLVFTAGTAASGGGTGNGGSISFIGGSGGSGTTAIGGNIFIAGGDAVGTTKTYGDTILAMTSTGANRGNVGVGSSTPSARLTVVGTSSTAGGIFDVASSTFASFFRVTNAGSVGVGTSTPGSLLTVAGTSLHTGAAIFNSTLGIGTSTPGATLDVWGNFQVGTSSNPNLFINSANSRIGIGTSTLQAAKLTISSTVGGDDALILRDATNGANARFYFSAPIGSAPDLHIGSNRIFLDAITRISSIENGLGVNGSINFTGGNTITLQTNLNNTNVFTAGGNANTVIRPYGSSFNLLLAPDGGLVGIGTSTPIATLTVKGTTTAPTTPLFDVASSSNASIFRITADGNVGIGTTTPTLGPLVMASGAYVSTGGTWTNSSDRNLKDNFTPVDGSDILNKIAQLPITRWNYKNESSGIMHIGPVAQDFFNIFGLGGSDTSISTIDPAGIALAGVQALHLELNGTTSASTTLPVGTSFFDRILKSLSDSIVYVKSLFADKVTTKELCVGDENDSVCVTKDQLRQLLQNNSVAPAQASAPTPSPAFSPTATSPSSISVPSVPSGGAPSDSATNSVPVTPLTTAPPVIDVPPTPPAPAPDVPPPASDPAPST